MRRSLRWSGAAAITAACFLTACGGGEPEDDAAEQGPPAESEIAADDGADASIPPERQPCGGSDGCTQIATVSQAHGEPAIGLYYDPERNDAVVRWSATLAGVIDCADGGGSLGDCVADSDAEDQCKAEFDRLSALGGDAAAFDAVFLTPGSPCRPEEGAP